VIAWVKLIFISTLSVILTACTGTSQTYVDTLKLAFIDQPDAKLSQAELLTAPYDVLYVTHGERARAAMVLMHLEAGQHKWVSADNALLVMEQGRIVRTVGFSNDLLYLSDTDVDPIRQPDVIDQHSGWMRYADWQSGEYGYTLRSDFTVRSEQVQFFNKKFNALLVVENVSYDSEANFWRVDDSWQNRFWFDSTSGTLLKSEQRLAPFGEPFVMTYISRIARMAAQKVAADE
jgi:hypothetical protein